MTTTAQRFNQEDTEQVPSRALNGSPFQSKQQQSLPEHQEATYSPSSVCLEPFLQHPSTSRTSRQPDEHPRLFSTFSQDSSH